MVGWWPAPRSAVFKESGKSHSAVQMCSVDKGGQCVTHVLRTLTDLEDRATVVCVDGIGAFDLISRQAMLSGLRDMEFGEEFMPFVSAFHGSPSIYPWEKELGAVHERSRRRSAPVDSEGVMGPFSDHLTFGEEDQSVE